MGKHRPVLSSLTLFDLDGTSKVVGRLPASVYAPRISPDGKRIAFETRDPAGPDGPRLWLPISRISPDGARLRPCLDR